MSKEIKVIYFTDNGEKIANELLGVKGFSFEWEKDNSLKEEYVFSLWEKDQSLIDCCRDCFAQGLPMVFIGAAGIAVRTIAPFLKDKLKDPPVVVVDDKGLNAISLVSGHYGGGNKLAVYLAEELKANPVITTATDINGAFSVDVFAKERHLDIINRDGIAKVSTKALSGKPITLSIKDYPPKNPVDVVIENQVKNDGTVNLKGEVASIVNEGIVAGIGCKKGKTSEEILGLLQNSLAKIGKDISQLSAIATIDIKEEEEGLKEISKLYSIPLISFDKDVLSKVEGSISTSDFVKDTVGVDNVCERAALAAVGKEGGLLLEKQAMNGVTVALACNERTNTIYVVGMGPGEEGKMTLEARWVLNKVDVIVGYTVYLELLKEKYGHKEMLSTPMKQEVDRCRMCFEEAAKGKSVAMVCSGDAGIYGMASIMYEISQEYPGSWNIEIVPGITAATSGSSILGAPLNHDFCVISLSDLLTPWETIEKRLRAAAEGDFAIAIYNPSSKKRKDYLQRACDILMDKKSPETCCGYVRNIGREGTETKICTLKELRTEEVDMFTTVFIGNTQTKIINNKLVTPRGYRI